MAKTSEKSNKAAAKPAVKKAVAPKATAPKAVVKPEATKAAAPKAAAKPETKKAVAPKAVAKPETKKAVAPKAATKPEVKKAIAPKAAAKLEAKKAVAPKEVVKPEAKKAVAPKEVVKPEAKKADTPKEVVKPEAKKAVESKAAAKKVAVKEEAKVEVVPEVQEKPKRKYNKKSAVESMPAATPVSLGEIKTEKLSYPDKINFRLSQIYFHLNQEKVNGVYVNYLPNIKYITGFTGSQAELIIFKDSIHFFTDDRYEEQVKTELYPLPNMTIHITRDLWNYVEKIGLLENVDGILFESDRVSYFDAVEFRNRIRPCKFKPLNNLIEPFTTSKATEEVELIKESCRIAEKVYDEIMKFIKPGMTEKEIANEISYLGRKYGSEGEAFDIIVTSGVRGAIIHGQPSDKKIRKGDIVLMDFGFKVKGFSSDISRTICVGAKPTREQRAMYTALYSALERVVNAVLPGMNGKTMDSIARKVINDAGFSEVAYKHSLGHGLGIETHEHPFLNYRQDNQIVPEDAVLAIEPGVYMPDKFGMRVEDNILVTKNGAVKLTNAPIELPYIL